jgi:putative transposase
MFAKVADHEAFEQVMVEAQERHPIRILSYCVVSNHWQFVVWPEKDGQLTDLFRWLAHTHAMRWRVSQNSGTRATLSRTIQEFPGTA